MAIGFCLSGIFVKYDGGVFFSKEYFWNMITMFLSRNISDNNVSSLRNISDDNNVSSLTNISGI